jgi:beta-glucanase (GH16 family)
VLSVANGTLRWDMHSENGVPLGAAVVPTLPTYGQTYGRYSVRFRADPVPGFGLAFLLWPDSEKWPRDGEIDFPEGELNGDITAAAHHATEAGTVDRFRAAATFDDWHVATTEWRPGEVTFLLDGNEVGRSTTSVPARSMHWVLQTGSDGKMLPEASARARIEVDWIEAQARR